MSWSTREVADLAGTTVNAVRHYHQIGLLEQPDRLSNGYKKYQVRHLVRILQIRRLRELGVPLDQIEKVGVGGDPSVEALHTIEADLSTTIERLERARAEIRSILKGSSAADLPAGFEDVGARLTTGERSLMLIYSQLYDDEAMSDVRDMVAAEVDDASVAFDALTPDADEATRQQLAEDYAVPMARDLAKYAWLTDPGAHQPKGPRVTRETLMESVTALFNPAQLDVLGRASLLATERLATDRAAAALLATTNHDDGEEPG